MFRNKNIIRAGTFSSVKATLFSTRSYRAVLEAAWKTGQLLCVNRFWYGSLLRQFLDASIKGATLILKASRFSAAREGLHLTLHTTLSSLAEQL